MHLRPRKKLAAQLKTVCRPVTMRVFCHTLVTKRPNYLLEYRYNFDQFGSCLCVETGVSKLERKMYRVESSVQRDHVGTWGARDVVNCFCVGAEGVLTTIRPIAGPDVGFGHSVVSSVPQDVPQKALNEASIETIDACLALAYNGADLFAKGNVHDARN